MLERDAVAPSREQSLPGTFEVLTDSGSPEDEERSVYAFVGDRPVLVRYDRPGNPLQRNTYYSPGQQIGPLRPFESADQAERALHSNDPAEILEVLLWMGAVHVDHREPNVYQEPVEDVERWQAALARPGVRSRISQFTSHPHPWVAEAARAVKIP